MNTEMLAELFCGFGRFRALRYVFEDPNRDFGPKDLAENAGVDAGNASRWLRRWEEVGLINKTVVLGRPRYTASKDPGLKHLLLLFQQEGQMATDFKERLAELGDRVSAAAVFGSVAKGTAAEDSDVDLLLLTDMPRLEAQAFFKPLGRKLRRPVNVTTFTTEEWKTALENNDPLVADIQAGAKIILKGNFDAA